MHSTPAGLRRLQVSALARRHASDARRVDRVLAAARLTLCSASLLATWITGSLTGPDGSLIRWVLTAYTAESLLLVALLELAPNRGALRPIVVHVADFAFAATITYLAGGPDSPYFVMFLFFILAAAYRWRLRETVWSGGAALGALAAQSWLLMAPTFDAERFILRAAYIIVATVLLGFLAEDEKQRRQEMATAGNLLAAIQAHTGFRPALRHVCAELLRIAGADAIVIAARETDGSRIVIWNAKSHQGNALVLSSSEILDPGHDRYFFDAPGDAWSIVRRREDACVLAAIDDDGQALSDVRCGLDPRFWERHPAAAAAVISVGFGSEWRGRVFILRWRRFGVAELRFLHRVLCQVVPAMHSQYLLRRLRSLASAAERRRVARELHDGVIQSLLGLELQAAALRRHAGGRDPELDQQLHQMQQLLADEARTVRDVMHQIRPLELGPRQLVPAMAEIVDRFGRESDIETEFHAAVETIHLTPRVARELVRTLQEALTNVRKHAAARHVRVRIAEDRECWRLTIANDGRPFEWAGRLNLQELEARRLGPRVIKERVREMGANMTIESSSGLGVTLEISLPTGGKEERRSA
jgi:signal transduction histidine kinase